MRTAEKIIRVSLFTINTSYHKCCLCKATALWITPPTFFTGPLPSWHLAECGGTSIPPLLDSETAPWGSATTKHTAASQHPPRLIKPFPASTIVWATLYFIMILGTCPLLLWSTFLLTDTVPIQHCSAVLYS